MRVNCIHGYFIFEESVAGQISHFCSFFGLEIERSGEHFTFSDLVDAPDYSLPGGTFLGCPTTKSFEGRPWEVMRENRLVYDFTRGLVVPISLIAKTVQISAAGNFSVTSGMILPGSLTEEGQRVTDYAAVFLRDRENFKYSEISYGVSI